MSDIAVVGPGAIGTTVAAALHEAGRTPLLCGRTPRERLDLDTDDGRITVPGPVLTDPALITAPADVVLLAVKATQIDASAGWLDALCGPSTVVCVFQNGVEQVAMVGPLAHGAQVIPSVVWFPAQRQPDGSVWLRGQARLTLPTGTAADAVAALLAGSRCAVEQVEDFTSQAWLKLIQNAVAGLMVLAGRRAAIFRRDDLFELARRYAAECLQVARAEGAVLDDRVPDEIAEKFRAMPTDMGTSILADRVADRPLEWDVRNGVIARLGRAHGIGTPISDVLVPLLAAASAPRA
jgi:2-dehydropantoate 2-reductase